LADGFHDYVFNWTSAGIETYIDDVLVANRTTEAVDQ
jgi:beta-glucanase (GH16 family)